MPDKPDAAAKAASRRTVPNHVAVYEALKSADQPMTAYGLMDTLRSAGRFAPPTVYRALNRLIREGRAHRIESLNAFVACTHNDTHDGPVVFAICDACGLTSEFSDPALAKVLSNAARSHAFTTDRAMVELHGRCTGCQDTTPEAGGSAN